MNQTEKRPIFEDSQNADLRILLESRERYIRKQELRYQRQQAKKRKSIIRSTWLLVFSALIIASVAAVPIIKSKTNTKVVSPFVNPLETVLNTKTEQDNTKGKKNSDKAEEENSTQNKSADTDVERYKQFDFYIEDNLSRYIAYGQRNAAMSDEEVVWRVNVNLDKPKFDNPVLVSSYDDPLIIVNKYYKVHDSYSPPDLQYFDGQLLRAETGNAYQKMRNDALTSGYNIRAVSGYRSVEYQRNLYNSYLASDSFENVERYSARAGHSEHHTGMAIDVFGSEDGLRNFINTPEYPWLKENAYKYGFIIRYTQTGEEITGYEFEPWHIRYVGTQVSTAMREQNIDTYEEYYGKYLAKR